ncbi:MAG: 3'-5' exonuclease [Candidatus Eremiobacteraeota bacterium]|nr:3'-5' exonuclease [Candidatus Eremiobacteraeota bacterium]
MFRSSLLSARYAFVDVETTGFSPTADAVVEVGCVVVEGGQALATFETLVNPGRAIPPAVTAIHGITDAQVVSKPPLAAVAPLLEALCAGAIVVAHNAVFDLSFLPFLQSRPSLCSYRFAARVVPDAPNHKCQTLRDFFAVRDPILESRDPHRALADAAVTRHIFFACLRRYLAAGLPNDVNAMLAFTRRHPQLCRYELRARAPLCHAEQSLSRARRGIEGQPLSRNQTNCMVSTATVPKFYFR